MLELDTPTNSQRDDMFSYLLLAASSVSAGVTILFSPFDIIRINFKLIMSMSNPVFVASLFYFSKTKKLLLGKVICFK